MRLERSLLSDLTAQHQGVEAGKPACAHAMAYRLERSTCTAHSHFRQEGTEVMMVWTTGPSWVCYKHKGETGMVKSGGCTPREETAGDSRVCTSVHPGPSLCCHCLGTQMLVQSSRPGLHSHRPLQRPCPPGSFSSWPRNLRPGMGASHDSSPLAGQGT